MAEPLRVRPRPGPVNLSPADLSPADLSPVARTRVTRTRVSRTLLVAAATVLVAGCGPWERSEDRTAPQAARTTSAPALPGGCATDDAALMGAARLASVDLDGDGGAEDVRLTSADSGCGELLVAEASGGLASVELEPGGPPVTGAFAVTVPGRDGQLLVTRAEHPRGGSQLRIYGLGERGLAEVVVEGRPIVPFLARDVREHPVSVGCTEGGLVITEAAAGEQADGSFGWEVLRTAYVLEGTEVTAGPVRVLATDVPTARLGDRFPVLARPHMFRGCREPTPPTG